MKTRIVTDGTLESLPEVSVARAKMVCWPLSRFCVLSEKDQLVVPEAVLQVPLSTFTSTFATATLSEAVPETSVEPETVEPLMGKLRATPGWGKAGKMLLEVTKYVSNGAKSVLPETESTALVPR